MNHTHINSTHMNHINHARTNHTHTHTQITLGKTPLRVYVQNCAATKQHSIKKKNNKLSELHPT